MKPTPLDYFASFVSQKPAVNPLIHHVAIDSRLIRPGGLFFALPGKNVDGHDFLKDVAAKGANAAVVRETYDRDHFGLTLIRVPNVLKALQEMATMILKERPSKIIAISGSIGKTTTKEFVKEILKTTYKVYASPKSYNTDATLPLNILMADGDEDFLILEMGMCRPGEIEQLVSISPPDIALLTTCALQHSTNFPGGLYDITREKANLFAHPKTVLGIFNKDIQYFQEVNEKGICPKMTFSLNSDEADYFLTFLSPKKVRIICHGESFDLAFNLPMFFALNFLAACALARACEVPWSSIQKAAPTLKLPAMRFERVEKKGILFINDAYNANPDSMKAALLHLPKPLSKGRKIAVLGEMNALGEFAEQEHVNVAKTALNCIDILLCLGKHTMVMLPIWKAHKKEAHFFETTEELLSALKKIVLKGDVVLLKGARAYSLDKILDHF